MTEADWLACTDPKLMLKFLGDDPGNESGKEPLLSDDLTRKLRLFACACCRSVWHLLGTRRSRRAVEVAERFADRQAGSLALVSACLATILHRPHAPGHIPAYAAGLVAFTRAIPSGQVAPCAWHCATALSQTTPGDSDASRKAESALQAALVREIFGNPFHPVTIEPSWITPTVLALAQAAYDNRNLPSGTLDNARRAALADALEEAGCTNPDILNHCRRPGEHVRGCWVLDLLLGKK
jgi:hypothetical protein